MPTFLKSLEPFFFRNQLSRPWVRIVLLWLAVAIVNAGGDYALYRAEKAQLGTIEEYRVAYFSIPSDIQYPSTSVSTPELHVVPMDPAPNTALSPTLTLSDTRAPYLLGWPIKLASLQSEFGVTLTAYLIAFLSTFLVTAPYVHFLSHGWYSRYYEFRNALQGDALLAYLKRFWSQRITDVLAQRAAQWKNRLPNTPEANKPPPAGPDDVFEKIYLDQYSSLTFAIPFVFILIITYLNSIALAVMNSCEEQSGACPIHLLGASTNVAIASMAGAYMFSVADSVMSIRRRTLNVSDMYWYGLRQFLAIPIALSFSIPAAQGANLGIASTTTGEGLNQMIAAGVSFAVALLPIDSFLKALRRFAYTALSINKEDEKNDQLLQLAGMTSAHVVIFLSEGIYSIDQIACMDPVLIAIRTGLPFQLITRFGGQAIVRRHFSGDCVSKLIEIGFGDATSILDLASRPPTCACYPQICKAIADRLSTSSCPIEQAVIEMKIRQIASENYTQMLGKLRNAENDRPPRMCSLGYACDVPPPRNLRLRKVRRRR